MRIGSHERIRLPIRLTPVMEEGSSNIMKHRRRYIHQAAMTPIRKRRVRRYRTTLSLAGVCGMVTGLSLTSFYLADSTSGTHAIFYDQSVTPWTISAALHFPQTTTTGAVYGCDSGAHHRFHIQSGGNVQDGNHHDPSTTGNVYQYSDGSTRWKVYEGAAGSSSTDTVYSPSDPLWDEEMSWSGSQSKHQP